MYRIIILQKDIIGVIIFKKSKAHRLIIILNFPGKIKPLTENICERLLGYCEKAFQSTERFIVKKMLWFSS